MNVLPIHRFPDPLLKHPTREVVKIDDQLRRLIDSMIRTMHHHPRCVGLAAPQIGSSLRVAVMDSSRNPKIAHSQGLIILVNPCILMAEGSVIQREGCLSVPDFTGNVRRASTVHVRAADRTGSVMEWRFEGFEAIVAQHELDHLDGMLFLDRVTNRETEVFPRKTYL